MNSVRKGIFNRVKAKNFETGRLGEVIAKKYLQDKGYDIIDQNYKTKYAEIDLIARHKGILVFVEVRTKTKEQFGTPEESINRNKINKLIKNAQSYAAIKNYNKEYRIDAICVILDENKKVKRITHYKNITF